MSFRAKTDPLGNELGKLKAEHLFCDVERRQLERKLEVKNDELEDLTTKLEVKNHELEDFTRKLGFCKDAEAKAIKKYKRSLEYNIEVEAEVGELKTRFEEERGELLGKVSDLKDKLMEKEMELSDLKEKLRGKSENLEAESHVNDVNCSSKSRKRRELSEGKLVGENEATCDMKFSSNSRKGNGYISSDASDHERVAEQMDIQIHIISGKTITMRVKPSSTVASLKSKIQDKEGIPAQKQVLIFARKQLDDNCIPTQYKLLKDSLTLAHYNIDDETIIRLGVIFPKKYNK